MRTLPAGTAHDLPRDLAVGLSVPDDTLARCRPGSSRRERTGR